MTSDENKRIRPDEVLPPDGTSLQARKLVTDAVLMMPNIVKLIECLERNQRPYVAVLENNNVFGDIGGCPRGAYSFFTAGRSPRGSRGSSW